MLRGPETQQIDAAIAQSYGDQILKRRIWGPGEGL
jgi:hypothetical protein